MKVRTRFAPSPTGHLHIGGVRTALFNWLYARKHQGEFLLRIEDTDQKRSAKEYTRDIFASLSWLGINSDVEPIFQSTRTARYQQVIQQLIDDDKAYYCHCSKERLDALREEQISQGKKPRYDGFCRNLTQTPSVNVKPVVRFKNPADGSVNIEDRIQGLVSVQNSELDDLILARSDNTPTYNLCVVVDDIDFAITHVIRGDDHLNNTSRQVNIFRALRKEVPVFAHIPLIHGKDGKRLSKRHAATSASQYRREGFLPQALLNYLVRLGWSHGDQEIFSIEEMIELFDLNSVHRSAATFDIEKLAWVNHQHMKKTAGVAVRPMLEEYFGSKGICPDNAPDVASLFDVQKERCKTLQELCDASKFFYKGIDSYDEKAAKEHFTEEGVAILKSLQDELKAIDNWLAPDIHVAIKSMADSMNLKLGQVAPPLRLAVTGQAVSPPIAATLELLGPEKSLHRLKQAIEYITSSI